MKCNWCQYCEEISFFNHTPHKEDSDCECKNHSTSTNILVKQWYRPWGKI